MTTAGDIGKETGYAVGKKASISSFVMRFGVGEGSDLSGKRLLLTVWPVRQC